MHVDRPADGQGRTSAGGGIIGAALIANQHPCSGLLGHRDRLLSAQKHFSQVLAVPVFADVVLAAARIHRGQHVGQAAGIGQQRQTGDRNQGNTGAFGQAFGGAQDLPGCR